MANLIHHPRLDLTGEVLAIDPAILRGMAAAVSRLRLVILDPSDKRPLPDHQGITLLARAVPAWARHDRQPDAAEIITVDGRRIAIIDLHGLLAKDGRFGSSLSTAAELLEEATDDATVDGIVLRIDSPGGTVAGTEGVSTAIAAARKRKPVYAYLEDRAAGVGYWIASQAERVYANVRTCQVGGIGVHMAVYDRSEQFAKAGVKPIVIRSGEMKAAGFPGTKVTDEQVRMWRKFVDQTAAEMVRGIARGRKVIEAKARQWMSGRLYLAADAVRMGLVDGVKSLDATLGEMVLRLQ